MFTDFRGVGDVFKRAPIAAVVEIMKRSPAGGGLWQFNRPFSRGVSPEADFAFHVMQSVTSTTVRRGSINAPAREPHPRFDAFNTCPPKKAKTLRCVLVHFNESDCFKYSLGAYQPPQGMQKQPEGWWCRGDSKRAQRWVDGNLKDITCPGRACEFQAEKFGPMKNAAHCKPHLTLLAQFDWETDKLPRTIFQFDSQSWNNISNCKGMFDLVQETALQFGYEKGTFPVFGLRFTMNLKVRVKGNRRWPEVSFSIEGNLMEWMGELHQYIQKMKSDKHLPVAKPLSELPPPGYSPEDMQVASEALLNAHYRPSNERGGVAGKERNDEAIGKS